MQETHYVCDIILLFARDFVIAVLNCVWWSLISELSPSALVYFASNLHI